jgi:hypothetical protein
MNKNTIISILVLLAFIGGVFWLIKTPGKGGKLDTFATCLKDKGVKFYGAFWCPHCANQKALFGKSVAFLPYVECSNPDGKTQNDLCNKANITGYPTWEFPDGHRENGEQTLAKLSELSSCQLPQS